MEHFGDFFEKQYGESLEKTLEKSGIAFRQLLSNIGLARQTTLNLAGLMIFGRYPQRYRPAFLVKAV